VPATRREKAARTETVLKQAAREVFAERGFHEAKVADIAAVAGRSVGSFYRHFAGKEEVLEALMADWFAAAGAELSADPVGDDLSEAAALRARVAVYLRTYRAHLPEIRALDQAAQGSAVFADRVRQIRQEQLGTLRSHLRRLAEGGHRLSGEPEVLAEAFNALLEGFCARWLGEGAGREASPEQERAVVDTLTNLLLFGLIRPGDPS
jgi:AcrR family transcriptional regulator